MNFSIAEYICAHGKLPRGRGLWAFKPEYNRGYPGFAETGDEVAANLKFTPCAMTYTEAKRWAKKAMAPYRYVVVCS